MKATDRPVEPQSGGFLDISMKEIEYPSTSKINELRIQPRDQQTAATRVVDLTKLTTNDVMYWFHRTLEFVGHPYKYVRHEKNTAFSEESPLGYEWTRVDVDKDGRVDELSREYLCMFCQWPNFMPLTGMGGMLCHFELCHPHEVPTFVKNLLSELGLKPRLEPRIRPDVHVSSFYDLDFYQTQLHYRLDGFSNQLRFAPRSKTAETSMLLAQVSEKNVMLWFHRDVEIFRKYQHENAKYYENTDFDPAHPEGCQISRILLDEKGKQARDLMRFLCIFCQKPTFVSHWGCENLMGHVAWYHWGEDFLSREQLVELESLTSALAGINDASG